MRSTDRTDPDRTDPDRDPPEPDTPEPDTPEPRRPDPETYNVAPSTMPPSPAGANADIGGEAAASRRMAGLPPELADSPEHRPGRPTPDPEPFLGYDGLPLDDVLAWIRDADPEAPLLRRILGYERGHRHREPIVRECRERLQRLGDLPSS